MHKIKNFLCNILFISIFILIIISLIYLIFIFFNHIINFFKIDLNTNLKKINYIYLSLTIITSIGVILVPIYIYCLGRKNNQNKLFTEIIQEYSTREMNDAIRTITCFVKNLNCEILTNKINKIKDKNIIKRKLKIIKTYKELHDYGTLGIINENGKMVFYEWEDLDYKRRIINNYFVKINLLCNKRLIRRKLITEFWSINSIKFLSQYIILLVYVALPVIHKGNPKDSMKPAYLVDFYNKYFVTKDQLKLYFPKLKKDEIKINNFKIKYMVR